MSCILKVAYLHKHKKYRYYQEKPINFNQMRQELGIHQPHSTVMYQLELPAQAKLSQSESTNSFLNEEQIISTLKSRSFEPGQTIKIKISVKNQIKERG